MKKIIIAFFTFLTLFLSAAIINQTSAQTCTGTIVCCAQFTTVGVPGGCLDSCTPAQEAAGSCKVCVSHTQQCSSNDGSAPCGFSGGVCGHVACPAGAPISGSCTFTPAVTPPGATAPPGGGGGGGSCSGDCFTGLSNCGQVGRVSAGGSCSNGGMCCGFPGGGGGGCTVNFVVPSTLTVGVPVTVSASVNGGSQNDDGVWGNQTCTSSPCHTWTSDTVWGAFNPTVKGTGPYDATFVPTTVGSGYIHFRTEQDNGGAVQCQGTHFVTINPAVTPAPTPAPNRLPVGIHESTTGGTTCTTSGWAYDPDTPSTSLQVSVYVNGPIGIGTALVGAIANVSRPDVNSSQGITGNHGFNINLSSFSQVKNGSHPLYVYAIDSNNLTSALLTATPISISCSSPTPTPAPGPTVSLTANGQHVITVAPNSSFTLTWNSQNAGRCDTGTSTTANWGSFQALPLSGSRVISGLTQGSYVYGIECTNISTGNMATQDSVVVTVSAPTPAPTIAPTPTPAPTVPGATPTPPPANRAPVGNHESVNNGACTTAGWAFDPDTSSTSIQIRIYMDGPFGSGTLISSATANTARADVNSTYGITGNHGFNVNLSSIAGLKGGNHFVYVYGVDTGGGANVLIGGTPKIMNCSIPSTPTPIAATPTPSPTLAPIPTVRPTPVPTPTPSPTPQSCSVNLVPATMNMPQNQSQSLLAIVTPSGSLTGVNFNSNNSGIASVAAGTVSSPLFYAQVNGNNPGTTTISVRANMSDGSSCTDTTDVTITPANPWWQAIGDVVSSRDLQSSIPPSCTLPSCNPNLILNGPNGLVGNALYGTTTNLTKSSVSSKGWLGNSTYLGKTYDYGYFSNVASASITFNNVGGVIAQTNFDNGTATNGYYYYQANGNTSINSNITISGNRKVVLFVHGNLTINGNINIANQGQGFFMTIVSGNINISPSVTSGGGPALEGLYEADGVIDTGSSANRLYVRGTLAGWRGVALNRNLSDNTHNPAETFEYSPLLTVLFPRDLIQDNLSWREVIP